MLRRLADEGLIKQHPTSGVFLTGAGQELARTSRLRHRTVECFLRALGISLATARIDAEGMEHRVSPETLAAFRDFLSKKPTEAASQSRSRASARMGRFPP